MLKNKYFILSILSISVLLSFSLWFSANAVIPQLTEEFTLSQSQVSLLSIMVTLGFIIGSLISAFFNIPDRFRSKNVFALAAILGAITNFISVYASSLVFILLTRFFIGFFLAGMYPTGMKLAIEWSKKRGFAIGSIVAALVLGSGLPYLFNLTSIPQWRVLLTLSAIAALVSAFLVKVLVGDGPYSTKSIKFKLSNIKSLFNNKKVKLASFGYFGHMWELYAMWAWIPVFLRESYIQTNPSTDPTLSVSFFVFLIFLLGGIGTFIGGFIADKYGKRKFNIASLVISGLSAIIIGFFFGNNMYALLFIAIIWGIAVIVDSPHYSGMVSEFCNKKLIGTALTIQLAIGFMITLVSIRIIPLVVDFVGWKYAFSILALGPLFGIISLMRLPK